MFGLFMKTNFKNWSKTFSTRLVDDNFFNRSVFRALLLNFVLKILDLFVNGIAFAHDQRIFLKRKKVEGTFKNKKIIY